MLTLLALLAPVLAAGTDASSVKESSDGDLQPALAFDGLLQTAWAEGAPGYGEGEWIELDHGRAREMKSVSIWPGFMAKGSDNYDQYTRPKLIRVLVDGEQVGEPHRLLDEMSRVDIPLGLSGRRLRIVVDEVFEGIVYSDLYITEVAVDFVEYGGTERSDGWWKGREAERMWTAHDEKVASLYEQYKAAEFGDREALAELMDLAIDGPLLSRRRVPQYAPVGYRAQAMRFSDKALEAIRKLRDANGIPAVELAALRTVGDDLAVMQEDVEIFRAIQELQSGGDRNIPYWGKTGWEPGALQSFGEPLAIEIDQLANVYVADTGNSRVARFDDGGRVTKTWGAAKPDITNTWFSKGKEWYVAGAAPGDGASEFTNPVDLELIPGKEADAFAVLDATNRVRIFDEEGRPQISWTVEVRGVPEPGLGGEAYLGWVAKKKVLLAVVGNDVVGYNLASEELFRWELEDGTPNAMEVLKNGKLLFAYHDEIVQYSLDGFRFGTVIDTSVIKGGFEDLDITLDEKGKLWLFTDTGWAYKFKKPGKVDLAVRVTEDFIKRPRIAVQDGLLFYTSRDSVKQIDVLQVILDQAQQEELREAEEAMGL